jgi:predicted DNA-binding mobile mystery protein A
MENTAKRRLLISQMESKLKPFIVAGGIAMPDKGWVNAIRVILNMTLGQLGSKLKTSAQAIRGLEMREASGQITLNALKDMAEAMDMKLVYAIVPKDGSLEKLIDKRVYSLARQIVLRTSASMKLEDQENSNERLEKAVTEKAIELKAALPKYLWE